MQLRIGRCSSISAIQDKELYKDGIEHWRRFYHLGYVNYDNDYP